MLESIQDLPTPTLKIINLDTLCYLSCIVKKTAFNALLSHFSAYINACGLTFSSQLLCKKPRTINRCQLMSGDLLSKRLRVINSSKLTCHQSLWGVCSNSQFQLTHNLIFWELNNPNNYLETSRRVSCNLFTTLLHCCTFSITSLQRTRK